MPCNAPSTCFRVLVPLRERLVWSVAFVSLPHAHVSKTKSFSDAFVQLCFALRFLSALACTRLELFSCCSLCGVIDAMHSGLTDSFIHFFTTHISQAQKSQLVAYRGNKLSPTSSVHSQFVPFRLKVKVTQTLMGNGLPILLYDRTTA